MTRYKKDRLEEHDDFGRDMELASLLAPLDPSSGDPNYWFRFRKWVVDSAGAELARRRLMAELTMGDVLTSWARTVVPTAVLAAAVAGLLLVRAGGPAPTPIGMEELLVSEVEGETIPAALSTPTPRAAVAFAAEVF